MDIKSVLEGLQYFCFVSVKVEIDVRETRALFRKIIIYNNKYIFNVLANIHSFQYLQDEVETK